MSFPERFGEHQSPSDRGTAPYVVALADGISKVDALLAIRACGARAICPRGSNAFLVETSVFALGKISQDARFASAAELLPQDKVPEGVAEGRVLVLPLAEADREGLLDFARREGMPVDEAGEHGAFAVAVTADQLKSLIGRGDVRGVERAP